MSPVTHPHANHTLGQNLTPTTKHMLLASAVVIEFLCGFILIPRLVIFGQPLQFWWLIVLAVGLLLPLAAPKPHNVRLLYVIFVFGFVFGCVFGIR